MKHATLLSNLQKAQSITFSVTVKVETINEKVNEAFLFKKMKSLSLVTIFNKR